MPSPGRDIPSPVTRLNPSENPVRVIGPVLDDPAGAIDRADYSHSDNTFLTVRIGRIAVQPDSSIRNCCGGVDSL